LLFSEAAGARRRGLYCDHALRPHHRHDHPGALAGPYRYVRHPIYTGILFAMLGMALAIGEWRALVGFAAMVLSFRIKSRYEEARMRETFAEYGEYERHTAALIPYLY
jgi:protein-S-isoprenylcysteine O-methyltransferase Ste14